MTIKQRIIDSILENLNISRETVDKVSSLIEQIDVVETDSEVEINIDLKNIKIRISK